MGLFILAGMATALGECKGRISSSILLKKQPDRLASIAFLHAQGKDSIASLLADLNDTETESIVLSNPLSSTLGDLQPYCGIISAYFIELILARSRLHLDSGEDYIVLGWNPEDYPFRLGSMKITEDDKTIQKTDVPKIALLYQEWWHKNKDRSMEELRASWAKGDTPLAKSPYVWR
jgi:hypothetical protein